MKGGAGILAAVMLVSAAVAQAASSGSVEMRLRALESRLPDADRLAALEKSLGSQGAGVLAGDVEQLKAEIRELRGLIEDLGHQIQKQQQGQRQLYGDLDKRLQALEARATGTPVAPEAAAMEPATGAMPAAGAANPPGAPPDPGREHADYLVAFELLQQGRTAEAIPAFEAFLAKYPQGRYTGNAIYWLGEANYVSKNYPQALAEFKKLVQDYPDSPKLSGALLKIGYIHYETRNFAEARAVLEKVKGDFPNTSTSALAAERLERMRKEGV